MRLIFIRHGETTANAEGRLQGHADYDLSDSGRSQAESLYRRFQAEDFQPTHIYSSPLRRTADTTRIVARSWSPPITFLDDLKEHDVGVLSGLTWAEAAEKYPEQVAEFQRSRIWDVIEGAETVDQQRARAQRVIEKVIGSHTNVDVVMMFSHGGILQRIVAEVMGTNRTWRVPIRNTAVFDFTLDLDQWSLDGDSLLNSNLWQINRFNDASHLG